jgi:asparagine synthase (glutamine-hydrolysing)
MCGITGFWAPRENLGNATAEQWVGQMADALRHRGPDDRGVWADPAGAIALGHRRLSIQDLSAEGHQPMHSSQGRFVLVFNGEIYNFQALRTELAGLGWAFRGLSDTEVLLAAIEAWGLEAALRKCRGMFACALWDRESRTLHLARDRAGEKPLYYGWNRGVFLFGSELKACRAHPQWDGRIDQPALALLLRYGYVPAPFCIYENLKKLPPGTWLSLTEAQAGARRWPEPQTYWSFAATAAAGTAEPFPGNAEAAQEQLHRLLVASVAEQVVADVPVGAFLSGGIDSSLIVALMQAQSTRPIRTFSIGFHTRGFDEAPFAKAVARHLGTDHTELYVGPTEMQQAIPRLPVVYDEPLADPSQIPTLLLCELARARVTVSLSGDAGDELFGGYNAYRKTQDLWEIVNALQPRLRRPLARLMGRLASWGLDRLPHGANRPGLLTRLANCAELLDSVSDRALYQLLMSPNRRPLSWLKHKQEPATRFDDAGTWEQGPDLLHRMMLLDSVTYLPDDILVKVDRAAMAFGLETRIPFLDQRIVEFAWTLPPSLKQHNGQGKWLLKRLLHQYVPASLIERPKQGFGVPIGEWLRVPLRSWAEDLLFPLRLRQEGFLDERTVTLKWKEHLTGRRDWGPALWHVLMFQSWLEQQRRQAPTVVEPAETEVITVG